MKFIPDFKREIHLYSFVVDILASYCCTTNYQQVVRNGTDSTVMMSPVITAWYPPVDGGTVARS